MLTSLFFFLLAGLAEIGGGYLVWLSVREGKPLWYGLLGGVVLIAYGIIPTFQPETNFGRIYAAYGGIFIVLSLLWGASGRATATRASCSCRWGSMSAAGRCGDAERQYGLQHGAACAL